LSKALPPFNNLDYKNFWGHSNFDTRHILGINWIYDLPYRSTTGLRGTVLGRWQITGVTQFQSGAPSSMVTSGTSIRSIRLT
jgi:hypothetical protein